MSDVVMNDKPILKSLEQAFFQANELLEVAFKNEMTSNKWDWPNGQSPRDIVDTGQLRDSTMREQRSTPSGPEVDHTWNTEYAMAVHEGAVFGANTRPGRAWIALTGKPEMPARPWTKAPLEERVLEEAFEKLAGEKLERVE